MRLRKSPLAPVITRTTPLLSSLSVRNSKPPASKIEFDS
jgi:hypothetical protein